MGLRKAWTNSLRYSATLPHWKRARGPVSSLEHCGKTMAEPPHPFLPHDWEDSGKRGVSDWALLEAVQIRLRQLRTFHSTHDRGFGLSQTPGEDRRLAKIKNTSSTAPTKCLRASSLQQESKDPRHRVLQVEASVYIRELGLL